MSNKTFPARAPEVRVDGIELPDIPSISIPLIKPYLATSSADLFDPSTDFEREVYSDEIRALESMTQKAEHQHQCLKQELQAAQTARDRAVATVRDELERAEELQVSLDREFREARERYERDWISDVKAICGSDIEPDSDTEIAKRFEFALELLKLPLPNEFSWKVVFEREARILQVTQRVPAISAIRLEREDGRRGLAKRDADPFLRRIIPAIGLHIAQHVARNDENDRLDTIAVNLWCRFPDKRNGKPLDACVLSLAVSKPDILSININQSDQLLALRELKGVFVYNPDEVIPVEPRLDLDKTDSRFVEGRDVLADLVQGQNLATMDWQDFEHLIRELFEKEFARHGGEVKITRASRDRGVDAVIFDPDPIRGGKFVIQAKRYTNVVDVSAVRDLYGTVVNEGAARGILVTTSRFGRDARDFVLDKPLSLIDGPNLLALLMKHGFEFKIDVTSSSTLA